MPFSAKKSFNFQKLSPSAGLVGGGYPTVGNPDALDFAYFAHINYICGLIVELPSKSFDKNICYP